MSQNLIIIFSPYPQICLLTSRLAAVDTMTHDIIRELLGVKLNITNYAVSSNNVSKLLNFVCYCLPSSLSEICCTRVQNLVDQEELHKLFIASQQQMEQSKLKVAHKYFCIITSYNVMTTLIFHLFCHS